MCVCVLKIVRIRRTPVYYYSAMIYIKVVVLSTISFALSSFKAAHMMLMASDVLMIWSLMVEKFSPRLMINFFIFLCLCVFDKSKVKLFFK